MIKKFMAVLALCMMLLTSACGNSPIGRAASGGLIGAGVGTGLSAIVGGDLGSGALLGAGVGALGGALTTPQQPRYYRHR